MGRYTKLLGMAKSANPNLEVDSKGRVIEEGTGTMKRLQRFFDQSAAVYPDLEAEDRKKQMQQLAQMRAQAQAENPEEAEQKQVPVAEPEALKKARFFHKKKMFPQEEETLREQQPRVWDYLTRLRSGGIE